MNAGNGRAREVEMVEPDRRHRWLAMEIDKVESVVITRLDNQDDKLLNIQRLGIGILISVIGVLIVALVQLAIGG